MIRRRLCLLFLLTGMTLFAYSQGLLFQANDKEIKERTSLQIFQEGEIPCFTKNFQLSFELSIRDFDTFGYVFLLKEDQGKTKYSFTYTYLDGENSTFKFNTDGKEKSLFFKICAMMHWLINGFLCLLHSICNRTYLRFVSEITKRRLLL